MNQLLECVEISLNNDKYPTCYFSAITMDTEIISLAGNTNKIDVDPTAHAEINAIRKGTSKLRTRHLEGCTIYSTCEPCPMCFSAIWWAKIPKLVYGVPIALARGLRREINIPSSYLNQKGGNSIEIVGGVLRNEIFKHMRKLFL